jgi:hypothetical protein
VEFEKQKMRFRQPLVDIEGLRLLGGIEPDPYAPGVDLKRLRELLPKIGQMEEQPAAGARKLHPAFGTKSLGGSACTLEPAFSL